MALNDIKKDRLNKLDQIKEAGIDPYPAKTERKNTVLEALDSFGKKVTIAGRLRSLRQMGKIMFCDLEDESGKIQLLFSQTTIVNYDFLNNLDIGDFLQVSGEVIKTQAGAITVSVEDFKLLTKSLLPLPSDFYGLKDTEDRLRKRYVDLAVNPEVRELFRKKSKFWVTLRKYLIDQGFIEVETPALESVPGGADATPFVTHHNALNRDFYLRISLELYQKRIIVGGFEKVFEIGKVFRNEGIDQDHLQDYLQMEFYWAYADYEDLMKLTEDLYKTLVKETTGGYKTTYQGSEIDWEGKWERVDYVESFKNETGIDLDDGVSEEQLREYAKQNNIAVEEKVGLGRLIDSIYKKTVRPKLIQPTFLINHPVVVSPLAKRKSDNPNRVERVQILAGGTEIGNGWSELNDPIDQLARFEEQQKLRQEGDDEAQMLDQDFVEALEYGMPPTAGFGLSQRLFAVIMDKPIRETIFFPPMKEEKK